MGEEEKPLWALLIFMFGFTEFLAVAYSVNRVISKYDKESQVETEQREKLLYKAIDDWKRRNGLL